MNHEPFFWSPQRLPGGAWRCFKDSPSAPPAPDYAALAQQQGAANAQTALLQSHLGNPNITSPLGSQTVSWGDSAPTFNQQAFDTANQAYQTALKSPTQSGVEFNGGTGQWQDSSGQVVSGPGGNKPTAPNPNDFYTPGTQGNQPNVNIALSPEQQALYTGQNQLSQGLLGLGQNSLNQTGASLNQPQDLQSVQDVADKAYGNYTSRLDPQWAQNEEMQKTQLANQGLAPGGEAYDDAMRVFNQGKNDAYTQANTAAIGTMPQTMQLDSAIRMQPLTELNAIRTGAQPQMPQFQPYQGAPVGQTPIFQGGLAQNQYNMGLYNSQVGQQNSMTSGLFGLAGALGSAYMMSDRRLKSNIVRVGDHPLGIGVYEYDIFGRKERGVMADEVLAVKPEAVARHESGYLMVDYGRL